jgi:hypothetical protein
LQADRLSTALRPLVCLAGVLESFRQDADDILRRFSGIRLAASTVRDATERAGARLAQRQQQGAVVRPARAAPWDFRLEGRDATAALVGLDAFSVPMQKPRGGKALDRMLYTAGLYTPDKSRSHYLADFDLDRLAAQMRHAVKALGLAAAERVIAVTVAGNGIEKALRRHFRDDLLCILDWYPASQHVHVCAGFLHAGDAQAAAWAERAKTALYERGGAALLAYLRALPAPAEPTASDELGKLINYFTDNEHRTDYPEYRRHGWDIGSGPTEAACKIVGSRLKQSGMRWVEAGAAEVAPLRALYRSGPDVWDAFWDIAA